MPLAEHGLCQHLKFPESLHDADRVQLVHKLFLCLLIHEMLLVALGAPVIADVSDADTS